MRVGKHVGIATTISPLSATSPFLPHTLPGSFLGGATRGRNRSFRLWRQRTLPRPASILLRQTTTPLKRGVVTLKHGVGLLQRRGVPLEGGRALPRWGSGLLRRDASRLRQESIWLWNNSFPPRNESFIPFLPAVTPLLNPGVKGSFSASYRQLTAKASPEGREGGQDDRISPLNRHGGAVLPRGPNWGGGATPPCFAGPSPFVRQHQHQNR